jgi:hypothetical protein
VTSWEFEEPVDLDAPPPVRLNSSKKRKRTSYASPLPVTSRNLHEEEYLALDQPPSHRSGVAEISIAKVVNGTQNGDIRRIMPGNNDSPTVLLGQMPQQLEVRSAEEDWTGITDAAVRRRLHDNSRAFVPQSTGNEAHPSQFAFHTAPTASTQDKFTCSHCGKAFKRKGDLTRHQESHRVTKFYCIYANCARHADTQGFYRKDKLVDHLESSHKMTKEEAKHWANRSGLLVDVVLSESPKNVADEY